MVKLNKEQFIDEIVGKLERIYGHENVQTSIQIKNNGVKFDAITIHRENRQLSPCVYIDKYYEKYKIGIMEIGDVVRKVVQKMRRRWVMMILIFLFFLIMTVHVPEYVLD